MNLRTTLMLLVLAGGIAAVVLWQNRREENWVDGTNELLFADVDVSRIHSIRLEAEDRPPGIRLERAPDVSWVITDPISYPARQSMVTELLRIIRDTRARPATPKEVASRQAPFKRLGIFDVEEELIDGTRRTTSIEVGDVDLDDVRLWVRRDGRILRTLRTLDTMLQVDVHEFRSDRILTVLARDIVGFRREGVDLRGGKVVRVDLEAQRETYAWRMQLPFKAQLDPANVELFLAALTSIRVADFIDDEPSSLSPYGLAAPQVTLRLEDRHGKLQEALFGQVRQGGVWFAHRPDMPYIWAADENAQSRLFLPFEELLDTRVLRVLRDDIQSVRLLSGEQEVQLERDFKAKQRRWTVAWRSRGEDEFSMPLEADGAEVDRVLGTIEAGELLPRLSAVVDEVFPPEQGVRGVWVTDVRNIRQGGRIGQRTQSEDGTPGWDYLREGDQLVCMVNEPVGALLELGFQDLRSRSILSLDEVRLRRLSLERDDITKVYERKSDTVWRHPESGFEAVELRPVLDRLFFLRASEHLDPEAARDELTDPLRIEIRRVEGDNVIVTLGLDPEGRALCDHLGLRSVLADPSLLDDLSQLLDG